MTIFYQIYTFCIKLFYNSLYPIPHKLQSASLPLYLSIYIVRWSLEMRRMMM